MSGALCVGQHALFESTLPSAHLKARELCGRCPVREECAAIAAEHLAAPGRDVLEGTWAGTLYGSTLRARIRVEDATYTDDEARIARNAAEGGDMSEWARAGRRVYWRRNRARRSA